MFGSPYIVCDGEPFFGADRLPQLEARLAGKVLMSSWHLKRLCVFCGSAKGRRPEYRGDCRRHGQKLLAARHRSRLWWRQHRPDGAGRRCRLQAGGEVTGVIPEALMAKEVGHLDLTHLEVVDSMHTRKARMAGTFRRFYRLARRLRHLRGTVRDADLGAARFSREAGRPENVANYFGPLIELCDRAVDEGFMRPEHRGLLQDAETPEAVLVAMASPRR